jgi:hypothetical protein
MIVTKTLRFAVVGLSSPVNITGARIAGACGGIVTTVNSVLTPWASTARIRSVTIWPAVGAETAPEVVWGTPVGAIDKDDAKDRAIPKGVSVDRALVSKPPRGTLCAEWVNLTSVTSSTLLQLFNVDIGGIVDFHVSFTLANTVSPTSITIGTAALGAIGYMPLDGHSPANYTPVGVPVIT